MDKAQEARLEPGAFSGGIPVKVYLIGIAVYAVVLGVMSRRAGGISQISDVWPLLLAAMVLGLGSNHLRRRVSAGVLMAGIGVYSLVLGLVLWRNGGFIEADRFWIFLLFAAIVIGQARTFLRDWLPFVAVLFGWQLLRGYADQAAEGRGFPLHNADLVAAERALFGGQLPTIWLQERLFDPEMIRWYDVVATTFWSFHFVLALLFAFMLWLRDRALYWRFVYALLALSFAGFATYVVFPAVPPWLAARTGTINETVWMVRDEVFRAWGWGANVSYVMEYGNPNIVAAMPSLHAAYPTLVFLFCLHFWRRLAPFALLYCFGLWFSIVYVGDHYVIDAIAGAVYAAVAFYALEAFWKYLAARRARTHTELEAQPATVVVRRDAEPEA